MFRFTKQEQSVIIFLLVFLGIGCGVSLYKRYVGGHQEGVKEEEYLQKISDDFATHPNSQFTSNQVKEIDLSEAERIPDQYFPGNPGMLISGDNGSPASPKININEATQQELEHLPHVGPVIAKRIVEYRMQVSKFYSLEDLKKVKGIGEKTFQKIKPFVFLK